MLFGYLALIIYDLWQKDHTARVNIPWLLAGGILVQFGWEAGLLIGGIRSAALRRSPISCALSSSIPCLRPTSECHISI